MNFTKKDKIFTPDGPTLSGFRLGSSMSIIQQRYSECGSGHPKGLCVEESDNRRLGIYRCVFEGLPSLVGF